MPKKKTDKLSLGNSVLISVFPFYGGFYYLRNKDEKPKASKVALQLAILSIVIMVVSSALKYQIKKNSNQELQGVLQDKLGDFLKKSENKNYKGRLNIGYVNNQLASKIKKATGDETTKGYEVFLYADSVRHIYNSHPDTATADFYNLLETLTKPQLVTKGYDKNGYERIKIINQYDTKQVVITEIHMYKDYFKIITMYNAK